MTALPSGEKHKAAPPPAPHLSVESDGEDVVGVAVVANLRTLLEVVDVHSPGHG